MKFSLIRLCFVYSLCTLHRAEPRRPEELQSCLNELLQRVRCETLAPALAKPFGPSVKSRDNKPVHLKENPVGIPAGVEVISPAANDRIHFGNQLAQSERGSVFDNIPYGCLESLLAFLAWLHPKIRPAIGPATGEHFEGKPQKVKLGLFLSHIYHTGLGLVNGKTLRCQHSP